VLIARSTLIQLPISVRVSLTVTANYFRLKLIVCTKFHGRDKGLIMKYNRKLVQCSNVKDRRTISTLYR